MYCEQHPDVELAQQVVVLRSGSGYHRVEDLGCAQRSR